MLWSIIPKLLAGCLSVICGDFSKAGMDINHIEIEGIQINACDYSEEDLAKRKKLMYLAYKLDQSVQYDVDCVLETGNTVTISYTFGLK